MFVELNFKSFSLRLLSFVGFWFFACIFQQTIFWIFDQQFCQCKVANRLCSADWRAMG